MSNTSFQGLKKIYNSMKPFPHVCFKTCFSFSIKCVSFFLSAIVHCLPVKDFRYDKNIIELPPK